MPDAIEYLLRRLISADVTAPAEILRRAGTSTSPALLVAAALLGDEPHELLTRAARHASATRDRQLVTIAVTHLGGDEDLLDALVRDHLADHPDSSLAAWIRSRNTTSSHPTPSTTGSSHA